MPSGLNVLMMKLAAVPPACLALYTEPNGVGESCPTVSYPPNTGIERPLILLLVRRRAPQNLCPETFIHHNQRHLDSPLQVSSFFCSANRPGERSRPYRRYKRQRTAQPPALSSC